MDINNIYDIVMQSIIGEIFAVIIGVVVVQGIRKLWIHWRYGNWKVIIIKDGKNILTRQVTSEKASHLLHEPADLSVFLKGIVSPYAHIKCDLITKGKEKGLFEDLRKERNFVINLGCKLIYMLNNISVIWSPIGHRGSRVPGRRSPPCWGCHAASGRRRRRSPPPRSR